MGMGRAPFGDGFEEYARADMLRLQRLAYTLTGRLDEAQDLVQDTLLKVGQAWRRIDERGPHSYATTVMCRAARRSRQRNLFVTDVENTRNEDPYRVVDDAVLLRNAMRQLAPRQRAVLALRFLCDMSERDTATVLECSVGTVKSQSAKALRKLNNLMSDYSDSHRDSDNSAR